MESIKDIKNYCNSMSKSIEDKLWFKQFLNIPIIRNNAVVYDYGCADGSLLMAIAKDYPETTFVGIDNSDDMIRIANAKNNLANVSFIHLVNLPNYIFENTNNILIMSSVFHEIAGNDITNWFKFYFKVINLIKPEYIFFRDMMVSESTFRYPNINNIGCIHDNSNKNTFNRYVEFIKNTDYNFSQKDIIHFLLKYRYVDNWKRELNENYLPTTIESIKYFFNNFEFFANYNIIYKKHYVLPFLKDRVKKDFNINLVDNTHCNIIFKRQKL